MPPMCAMQSRALWNVSRRRAKRVNDKHQLFQPNATQSKESDTDLIIPKDEEKGDKNLKKRETKIARRKVRKLLILVVAVLLLVASGAIILFREELKIVASITKVANAQRVYYMEVEGDYHFKDFLEAGGASSDKTVSAFLTKRISKGLYSVDVKEGGPACSTISAVAPDGSHVWGRNFDWKGSVPIIVRCVPQDGYASISTCDFQNITANPDAVPEGIGNKMFAIAALYVPMDGMNEVGLCVADLEVNEGGMITMDTDKPNLTITTAIRLLLNKAASVEQAVALLRQYDIFASGGISHHLAISDSEGNSVAVEFVGGKLVIVDTNVVTNFNLDNGNTAAGGENAKQRFEWLSSLYKENEGLLAYGQVKHALAQVSQSDGEFVTQWSIIFEQDSLSVNYYFGGDFENAHSFSVHNQ